MQCHDYNWYKWSANIILPVLHEAVLTASKVSKLFMKLSLRAYAIYIGFYGLFNMDQKFYFVFKKYMFHILNLDHSIIQVRSNGRRALPRVQGLRRAVISEEGRR